MLHERRRVRMAAAVLAWVGVVVVAGLATQLVVSRAGQDVGQASAMRSVAPQTPDEKSIPASRPPATSASPSTSSTSSGHTASFPTAAGTVVASCADSVISLQSITVSDGWAYETEREHENLSVHFRAGDREIELELRCRDGRPTDASH